MCGEKIISKYQKLWDYIKEQSNDTLKLTYDEITQIAEVPLDHSFLTYKKELLEYGWTVKKIYMKEKQVEFIKNKQTRGNFLFCGSEDGARSSCLLFSLIECAKLNSINPEDYLRCLFDAAPYCNTEADFERLLPWNLKIDSFVPNGEWL